MIRRVSIVSVVTLFVLSMVAIPTSYLPRRPVLREEVMQSDDLTFESWFKADFRGPMSEMGLGMRLGVGEWQRLFLGIQAGDLKVAFASSPDLGQSWVPLPDWSMGGPIRLGTRRYSFESECWGPSGRTARQIRLQYADVHFASLPLWLIAVVTGLGSVWSLRGPLCRWRRRRKGLCVECAYDLTGNVTGTCSECGAKLNH